MTEAQIAAQLQDSLNAVADDLLFRMTTPWELDAVMTDFGFAAGVCALQDAVGLDTICAQRQKTGHTPTPVLTRMVAEGRLGRAVGVGWYRYPGGGGPVVDPLVEDLLREEAWFAQGERKEVSDAALMTGLLAGLLREGLSLMSAGAAPDQIDRVSCDRLGFPRAKGGLLSHARAAGLVAVGDAFARV
ncbi:3-hydroxyacyl-CoA dehydrogenase family protein [uncultured Roseobacter sp.]|uniref:3-hydroxyacyl-CoA dehydrogenase family protein n=1 Tax=uncultured Roseobacter sp. TaxID=114847 RepID=UPI0026369430|nr:3-hydroxyacyl-CoA dehydrogenase family protein [uncultured Roseobacter sp.]